MQYQISIYYIFATFPTKKKKKKITIYTLIFKQLNNTDKLITCSNINIY